MIVNDDVRLTPNCGITFIIVIDNTAIALQLQFSFIVLAIQSIQL
jgi:hypothetical protein